MSLKIVFEVVFGVREACFGYCWGWVVGWPVGHRGLGAPLEAQEKQQLWELSRDSGWAGNLAAAENRDIF